MQVVDQTNSDFKRPQCFQTKSGNIAVFFWLRNWIQAGWEVIGSLAALELAARGCRNHAGLRLAGGAAALGPAVLNSLAFSPLAIVGA